MKQDLVGKHVVLDGQKEKIVDAGEERTDDKGYRVVRIETASGKVRDVLSPVQTCEVDDLIPIKEACKLIPSHVPGKRLSLGTAYRWILSGRLPAIRRGSYYFVHRADVLRIAAGEPVQVVAREPRNAKSPGLVWAEKVLREKGVLPPEATP